MTNKPSTDNRKKQGKPVSRKKSETENSKLDYALPRMLIAGGEKAKLRRY